MFFVFLPEGGFRLDELACWKGVPGGGGQEGTRYWLRSRGDDYIFTPLSVAEFTQRVQAAAALASGVPAHLIIE